MMTTYQTIPGYFADIAIRPYRDLVNQRTWNALAFCIHPAHDSSRTAMGVDRAFTLITTKGR